VRARVLVRDDRGSRPLKPIYDTFGIVRGSEFPEEIVLIGGHRDAWGPGTADNVSGTVSILEAARAVAEQLKQGIRPKRTIVFATWDAEEWGLIGAVEYVEDDSLRLSRNAVAYFNQDVAAQGYSFLKTEHTVQLAEAAQELKVQLVAVGVHSENEARTCREIGCHLAQGDHFGHAQTMDWPLEGFSQSA